MANTLSIHDFPLCSDPEAYSQLMICISGKYEETPVINNAVLSEQDNTDTTGSFNMFLPRYIIERKHAHTTLSTHTHHWHQ